MAKLTKRQKALPKEASSAKIFPLTEGVQLVKKCASAKFDESVDLAVRLGVDPRKADQMVRGTCALPHGTGKKVRVLALSKGALQNEAKAAGADFVGGEEMIAKIQEGWMDFDVMVVTPDMMASIGKIGKLLGPRGLMPNPKSGTVTPNLAEGVKKIKAGQVSFRVDKAGIVHVPVGRASFEPAKLAENVTSLMDTIRKAKPSSAKGVYLKSITLSSTMGPGVALETNAFI